MRIYSEKERAEQGKCKMHRLRRKGTPGSGVELSPEFKEINRLRNGIRQRPAKLPIPEKELKNSLGSGIKVTHSFIPALRRSGRSRSSRPAWCTEQDLGQPNLGS